MTFVRSTARSSSCGGGGGAGGTAGVAMVKAAVVAEVRPGLEKVKTLSVPTRSIASPLPAKFATPLAAVSVRVPASVPVPVVSAAVTTEVLSLVTVLLNAS